MVGYVAPVTVVVVLSMHNPALVLQNSVPTLAVHVVVGDLQATTTSRSPCDRSDNYLHLLLIAILA